MPPAIVPQITMIIMLLPEKTEPECLDQDMLIHSIDFTNRGLLSTKNSESSDILQKLLIVYYKIFNSLDFFI